LSLVKSCFDKIKNVITNYMPVLFEEDALETVGTRGLVNC
jgi:hypothetical protein